MDHGNSNKEAGIHTSVAYEYADAAARLGDTTLTLADRGKLALQLDGPAVWMWVGSTWLRIDASPVSPSPLIQVSVDVSLLTTESVLIDTRPVSPAGINRWKLVSADLRLKEVLSGGTAPTSIVSMGTEAAGTQIILGKSVDSSIVAGTILGGFALSTLGADMAQLTGFEVIYPAGQAIYVNVTATGAPTGGIVTGYLLWQALP